MLHHIEACIACELDNRKSLVDPHMMVLLGNISLLCKQSLCLIQFLVLSFRILL